MQPIILLAVIRFKSAKFMFDTLNAHQVISGLESLEIMLIDVRNSVEFCKHHMEGAINIPTVEIPDRINELPTNKKLVFCCEDGRMAGSIATFLAGYAKLTNLYSLSGGVQELELLQEAA